LRPPARAELSLPAPEAQRRHLGAGRANRPAQQGQSKVSDLQLSMQSLIFLLCSLRVEQQKSAFLMEMNETRAAVEEANMEKVNDC